MQRLCTTLCGLLASCLCSWGSTDSFYVTQFPSEVELTKGKEIQIICSWNITVQGAKVKWFKNNQKLELNQSDRFTETCKNNNSTTLMIKKAERSDEGLYICEITQDIPHLLKVNGTGTNIIYKKNRDDDVGKVTTSTQTNSATKSQTRSVAPEMAVWASASATGVILFICVCVCVWWIKTRNRQSERMVIRQGPPSEGDEPEHSEDGGSSRTSRGSTQWYMVPVYESYFDLQRSEDEQCAASDTDTACAAAKKC
ncbi:uncharacterized protein LOC131355613 [Hemibagrus wyckioides]|nr:uncharacterized protein LOC131355613 [Hemibagrus wyckioides]